MDKYDFIIMRDTPVRIYKLMNKYPDKAPIIIDDLDNGLLEKKKYLIPRHYTIGQFISILRNHTTLKKHEAIFIMFDNILEPCSAEIGSIYDKHYNPSTYLLHATIRTENTFG